MKIKKIVLFIVTVVIMLFLNSSIVYALVAPVETLIVVAIMRLIVFIIFLVYIISCAIYLAKSKKEKEEKLKKIKIWLIIVVVLCLVLWYCANVIHEMAYTIW